MDYDDIIEEVGGFGLYQKFIFSLVYFIPLYDGMQIASYVFIVPEIKHRCKIPGLENDTYEIQDNLHEDLIEAHIPQYMKDGSLQYNRCLLYGNQTQFDGNRTTFQCNSWVYDKSVYQTSITSDMSFVCNQEIFTSHVKTTFFVGAFVMFLIGGWISDRFGRKITIVFSCLLQGISSLLSSQVNNIPLLFFLRFLSAVGGAGSFSSVIVYVTEITSKQFRSGPTLTLQISFPIAFMLLCAIAYFVRYWRLLMIIISTPLIIQSLLIICFLPESPRWLINVKKEKKAGKILNKLAKMNKKEFLYQPKQNIEISDDVDRKVRVWKIFTIPFLLKRTLIMICNWFSVVLVYYGLTLNVGSLDGNVYLNLFLNSLVELPAIIFAVIFVNRFGRKKLILSFLVVGGISGMLTIFPFLYAPKDLYWTSTILIIFSKLCISGAFSIVYLFTCELYPTCVRNASLGFFCASARVSGLLSPYIMNASSLIPGRTGKSLPFILMGFVCFFSGSLNLFLTETANQPLLDTFDEVIRKKNKKDLELEETTAFQKKEENETLNSTEKTAMNHV